MIVRECTQRGQRGGWDGKRRVYMKHMPEMRVGHLRRYVHGKMERRSGWHRLVVLTYMCFFIELQFNVFPGPSCISHVTELWPMNF